MTSHAQHSSLSFVVAARRYGFSVYAIVEARSADDDVTYVRVSDVSASSLERTVAADCRRPRLGIVTCSEQEEDRVVVETQGSGSCEIR